MTGVPASDDDKTMALKEAKEKLVDTIARQPGTGYVDYRGNIRQVAKHGNSYNNAGEDQIV